MSAVKSSHEPISGGMPVRGKFRNTTLRYDLSPVFRPIQKGELVESASTWGRKYRDTFIASIRNSRSSMPMCTWVPK
jgi:hypothetical protein